MRHSFNKLTQAGWCFCPADFIRCRVNRTGLVERRGPVDVISFHALNLTSGGKFTVTWLGGDEPVCRLGELLAVLDAAVWVTTRPGVVPQAVPDLGAEEVEAVVTGERAVLVRHLTTSARHASILGGGQDGDTGLSYYEIEIQPYYEQFHS